MINIALKSLYRLMLSRKLSYIRSKQYGDYVDIFIINQYDKTLKYTYCVTKQSGFILYEVFEA